MIYEFKVSLFSDKQIYRHIEIEASDSLERLHHLIFKAFDRDDQHLYSFYLSRVPLESLNQALQYDEYTLTDALDGFAAFEEADKKHTTHNVLSTKINELALELNDRLYYLFDFGDEWWHELTLLSIRDEESSGDYPRIVKRNGDSPPQYPTED